MSQRLQTPTAVNLTVLQRTDPCVEEILITSPHVSLYKFDIDLHQWSRKDVEGSLFVVKRNAQPRFQFIVMNRQNTDNLVEDLLGDFEFDLQVPYILYRKAAQEVNGIWFYNEQDCEAVANLFSRILTAYSIVSPKSILSSTKSSAFGELEAVPTAMECPLELPTSSAPVPEIPDDSFVNSFNEIMSIGSRSNSIISGQQNQSSATTLMSSLMHSVIPSLFPPQQSIPSVPTPSAPLTSLLDTVESRSSNIHATDLVKPSFFTLPSSALLRPPVPSSIPTAPPLHPPVTMQRPYGTPLLQPFPPPAPPLTLTPIQSSVPVITRDKVQDALLRLVQNDRFIDMVYREMMNS